MGHLDSGTAGRNRSCSELLMVAMVMKEWEWCCVSPRSLVSPCISHDKWSSLPSLDSSVPHTPSGRN